MPGMGPAPKPAEQRARRNASIAMTKLPACGRRTKAPDWPLPPDRRLERTAAMLQAKMAAIEVDLAGTSEDDKASKLRRELAQTMNAYEFTVRDIDELDEAERARWVDLWKTPQAMQWEKLKWNREVGMYARLTVRAERGDLDAGKEARQLSDRLGLNPLALLRLRWEIEAPGEAKRATRRTGSRARYGNLRVVDPGA